MIIFRLTMVKVPTWDGTWSGADKVFVRRRLDSVVPASVVGRVFIYEWDDGWSVRISVEKVSAVEAIGIAKQSKGFCGYDWMIDSIIKYGEILDERGRAKKDGYFFYNGEHLSPEDVAVRLTEYKDKIAELEADNAEFHQLIRDWSIVLEQDDLFQLWHVESVRQAMLEINKEREE